MNLYWFVISLELYFAFALFDNFNLSRMVNLLGWHFVLLENVI